MDKNLQNKLAWSILTIVVVIFVVSLYIIANLNQQSHFAEAPRDKQAIITPSVKEAGTTVAKPSTATTTADSENKEILRQLKIIYGISNSYNVIGTSTSPRVTIVEFGDFTCVHCLASYPVVLNLVNKYRDRVQFIWRDRTPTVRSMGLSLSAHCAGDQGKFWEMHDALFQAQSDTLGIEQNDLVALANKLGLDTVQFKTCLDNKKFINDIKKNLVDSERLAVAGTPTWYVNGIKYAEGEINKTDFENYLLLLLNN